MTALMLVVSLLHRDTQAIQRCRAEIADFARDEYEREFRGLPLQLHLDDDRVNLRPAYRYAWKADGRPYVTCYCDRPHGLFLRADGRHILTYDGRTTEVQWLTEAEFRVRAAALHLPIRPRP